MKITSYIRSAFIVKAAFFILLSISATAVVNGQGVTFAQFIERNGTNDFVFTNNATSASFQTVQNGSPVLFTYQNINFLPPELQGVQLAHVFVTATTTVPAFQTVSTPPRDVQPFNQTFTIQILRDTPASPGSGSGTLRNLLTAVITPNGSSTAALSGDDTSNAAAFTASTPDQTIVFTSDFLGFQGTTSRNLGISFSSINPLYSIGPGGFLNSFSGAGTGTFASNPAPVFSPPTASNVTVGGRVLIPGGKGLSYASVSLVDSSGELRTTVADGTGRFQFNDISSGQIVTVSVNSRRYQYASQVIDVSDSVIDLSFTPQGK
jgi:hypothetical protein